MLGEAVKKEDLLYMAGASKSLHCFVKIKSQKLDPVRPCRTPPSSKIQSLATQKCCGVVFSFSFCIIFFTIRFFSIENFVILRFKYFIPYYCIYTNVIPQNLNSLLRLVVAKWTFAVWFHAKLDG